MRSDNYKITCKEHNMTMTADTPDELATKYMDHMKMQHNKSVTMSDAMKMVQEQNKDVGMEMRS